jgi:probable non-F420 flavinoid oxidoreductase
MVTIGYHASHEQFLPADLLGWAQRAEQAGFTAAMCSDHITPWSVDQGQSAFAWSWLGAAMQATTLPFGTVNAPGYRYHPAIIAQAAATLASMYPGRFWLALGSGEAMNEHITGLPWPGKPERRERLAECVDIIRALWRGETVSHHGRVIADEAKLWTLPETPPALIGAALTPETAAWCGGWADGLITVNMPPEQLAAIVDAFRANGGEGKPISLQIHLSYASTDQQAEAMAMKQWRTAIISASAGQELKTPEQFDQAASFVRPEDMRESVRISSDPARHLEWLQADQELGFDHLYLHNVGPNQDEFIDAFAASVLPNFR